MSSKKLTRTTYRDPTDPSNPLRSGDVARAEAAKDMDEFYRPLEQVHASGLHQFGAADGLRVNAANGAAGIHVLPGIALDGAGRHISLAAGGQAEVGPQADAPGAAPQLVIVDAANGALLPTTGVSGDRLVVIRHWETFDENAWNSFGAFVFVHTPWIRLVPTAGYVDNGDEVVLARVTFDAQGTVTGLTPGPRHGVGLPTETVRLRRARQAAGAPAFGVDNGAYGEIRPRANGGMQITAMAATDAIDIQRDDGGALAQIALAADQTHFRRNDGLPTVRVESAFGNLEVGTKGVEGDVLVFDGNARLTVALNGQTGAGTFGAEGLGGEVRVLSQQGQNAVQAQGNGDVWFRGRLRDYNNSHDGVTHGELAQLTNGGVTALHRHDVFTGASGTRIGVKSGRVFIIDTHSVPFGSVTLNFQTGTKTPTGTGFHSATLRPVGGTFSATPHAIVAATRLSLSTASNTWFEVNVASITPSTITISWQFDSAGAWGGVNMQQAIDFLVVGPMA